MQSPLIVILVVSAGLEPVLLSHTEKSCIASFLNHLSTNKEIKITKLIPVLLERALGPLGLTIICHVILLYYPRRAVYNTVQ